MDEFLRETQEDEQGYYITIDSAWETSGSEVRGYAIDLLAEYENLELTPKEVEAQLSTYSALLCEITNNKLSKTNYDLETILSIYADEQEADCDEYCSDRERLREYEAIGLAPEELRDTIKDPVFVTAAMFRGAGISKERTSEILNAELDGRLLVIPKGNYKLTLTKED